MDVPMNATDEDLFHIGMELVNEIDAGSDGEFKGYKLQYHQSWIAWSIQLCIRQLDELIK